MKIGILVGRIPPPVFINHLVFGLEKTGNSIVLYGSSYDKIFKYNKSHIIVKANPQYKIFILFKSLLLIFKILIFNHRNAICILYQIKRNETSIRSFLYRCCKVLPPFLDNLDIFHIQWAKTLVEYPEFIEKLKCSVVLSLRGAHINYSPLSNFELAEGYRKYFPQVSGFHAVSKAIGIEAEKYGADSQKISVIFPAVNEDLIKNVDLEKKDAYSNQIKIISVGRCHWKKGYTIALDTMLGLKRKGVNFHYTIIADGKDEENINYQIQDLGLNDFVSFVNGLPHEKVIKMITSSDLFLLPSVEEGISNAVLEAMALGITVIVTQCGGMTEVIKNGENGFIVPVRDSIALQQSILNPTFYDIISDLI